MAHEVDWLNSQAGMCNVNFYQPDQQKDQERKVICFADLATLNSKDKYAGVVNTDASSNISDPHPDLDMINLEEKEVIVIKDDEQHEHMNTEGALCLLKPGTLKDANVVTWLSNDLQKYTIGFQHALTPSVMPHKMNAFDTMSCNNNNTAPSNSEGGTPDDVAYYANKLCSLVLDMTRKEIKDKWESSGKYTHLTISPHSAGNKATPAEGTEDRKPPKERSVRIEDSCPYERSCPSGYKMSETTYSDKERKHEGGKSVSQGMMIYANQVASDMMLSFLKTLKVQKGRRPPPACIVLKDVLVRHVKEVVSDLIDSSMKNLHNMTGALMTDSDFVCGLKKNLYHVGTQKTAEVLDAMVKRLFKLLDEKQVRAQSLAFTSYKTGSQSTQRLQGMHFASLKSESHSHGQEKDRGGGPTKSIPTGSRRSGNQGSLEMYAKDILLTVLTQIQQHLLEKNRDSGPRESSKTSTFGYVHHDTIHDRGGRSNNTKHSSRQYEGRAEVSDCIKDKGNLILSMVQKILQEAGLNIDDKIGDRNRW